MTREEAIQVLQTALTAPLIYGDYADAISMAIEALSANTKAVYCWECKYKYDCVQYMLIEGKYEIIHSCSYGGRKEE